MKYGVIVADPPWTFQTYSEKGKDRSPEKHYSCMTLPEIQALDVAQYASDDCVLLLWVTNPSLLQGLSTMEAWGFTYKTVGFCWAKLRRKFHPYELKQGAVIDSAFHFGLGYYTRANVELCLLGTRGSPKRMDAGVRQLIVSPVREHSRKPDELYDRVRKLMPGPYLELFSRMRRSGWDVEFSDQPEHFQAPVAPEEMPV